MHLRLKRIPSSKHYNDRTIAIVAVESYRKPGYDTPRQRFVAYLGSIRPSEGWRRQGGSLSSHLKAKDRRKLWRQVEAKLDALGVRPWTRICMERWLNTRIPRP